MKPPQSTVTVTCGGFFRKEVFFPMNHTAVRRLVTTALCVALGCVLPQALHAFPNGGMILLPMHIPVLLCGLTCSPAYGLGCGLLTPLLSHLGTGMPAAPMLPAMLCELGAYGLTAGLAARCLRTGNRLRDLYAQLIVAMLTGRAVYGLLNALVFQAGKYSLRLFFSAAFLTALPGILLQLLLLPTVILLLERANFLPSAYDRV